MKQEYNLKDKVYIHLGERTLVEGRVVEIIDFAHLNEGHSPDNEYYVIEIKTGIDDIYEVRSFDQISPDAGGPINLFRKIKDELKTGQRYLKKVGIKLPIIEPNPLEEIVRNLEEEFDNEPTPEQIHAALASAAETPKATIFRPEIKKSGKRRPFTKRKKPNAKSNDNA